MSADDVRADDVRADDGRQGRLPLEVDGEPIPFALTAKARRAVAPDSLPDLSVVPGSDEPGPDPDGDGDGPPSGGGGSGRRPDLTRDRDGASDPEGDTRAARARALRRAGMSWSEIATELDIDEVLARAWVDAVAPVRSARRRGAGEDHPTGRAGVRDTAAREEFEVARSRARTATGERLVSEPGVAAGLGLLAGAVEVEEPAVTLSTPDRALAGAVLDRIRALLGLDAADLRVVLRLAPEVAGDRARDAWSRALGLPAERITTTRWSAAPHPEATAVLVRLTDPAAAGTVAGCRDALLAHVADGSEAGDRSPVSLGA